MESEKYIPDSQRRIYLTESEKNFPESQRRNYLTESEKYLPNGVREVYTWQSEKNLPDRVREEFTRESQRRIYLRVREKFTWESQRSIYLMESEKYIPLPSMPSSVLVTPCSPSTVFGNNSPLKSHNSVYFNFLYDLWLNKCETQILNFIQACQMIKIMKRKF